VQAAKPQKEESGFVSEKAEPKAEPSRSAGGIAAETVIDRVVKAEFLPPSKTGYKAPGFFSRGTQEFLFIHSKNHA
jgi:hypothetical protein